MTKALVEVCPVILAGGKGTRLKGILQGLPKPLATVCRRPFIYFIFDKLIEAGFDRAVISVGYNKNKFREIVGSRYEGLNLYYAEEDRPLDTAGAIKNSVQIANTNNLLVFNGDSFCELDLLQFMKDIPSWAVAALVVTSGFDGSRYGAVSLSENGLVQSFDEKPTQIKSAFVNAGIYWFSSNALEGIPEGVSVSLEKDSLPKMISQGIYAWKTNQELIDIGTPESLRYAQGYFSTIAKRT